MKTLVKRLGIAAILGLLVAALPACDGGSSSSARVTFVLGADGNKSNTATLADAALDKGHADVPGGVDVDDIAHLFVDVTHIELTYAPGEVVVGVDGDNVIEVSNRIFDPVTIEIVQGESVTWQWSEDGLHTVTSGSNAAADAGSLFDASMDATGDQIVVTFPDAGSFEYFSDVQEDIRAGMVGAVLVLRDSGTKSSNSGMSHASQTRGPLQPIFVVPVNLTMDLRDLTVTAGVLSANQTIPAGSYTGITLHVENPELRLASDPDTPIRNVRLTANGRLTAEKVFNVPPGDDMLIGFEFGGVHLVQVDDGSYVLTSLLHADIDVRRALVQVQGVITSLDCNTGMMTVNDKGTIYEVMLAMDAIFLDENGTAIDCSQLNEDEIASVGGALDASLTLFARAVQVLGAGM